MGLVKKINRPYGVRRSKKLIALSGSVKKINLFGVGKKLTDLSRSVKKVYGYFGVGQKNWPTYWGRSKKLTDLLGLIWLGLSENFTDLLGLVKKLAYFLGSALSFTEIFLKNDHRVSINEMYYTIFSKVLCSALCLNLLPSWGKPYANISWEHCFWGRSK